MQKMSLCGEWKLFTLDNKFNLLATVPGCNYTDLLKANLISDPFDKPYEKDARFVGETDWIYEKLFVMEDAFLTSPKIYLKIRGLDTLATIYINGSIVAKAENAHIDYSFDVKPFLIIGDNTIKIEFASPINYIKEKNKLDRMPANMNGLSGFPHIRKPACHFGWDWGPILPPSGITSNIELVAYEYDFYLSNVIIDQQRTDNAVTLFIKATTDKPAESGYIVKAKISSPSGEVLFENEMSNSDGALYFTECYIENPTKWYANGMTTETEQPLYSVLIETINQNTVIDSKEYKVGIRSIKIDSSADAWGNNFAFVVNGDTIFAKGANWIPSDSFINRLDDNKLEYLIRSLAVSNVNMIRVWGGGYYESDKFYELCDRFGILVWQDFAFACAPYPFYNEDFLNNLKSEIESVAVRLRHHPSLAVWCGNNEIEMMSIGWAVERKLIKYSEIFFYHILPELLSSFDSKTPYIHGSPFGSSYMKNVNSDTVGDTHLWHVWHGLQPFKYYRTRFSRFCSEFGFESLPDIDTIKSFAKKDEDFDIVSEVMLAHQKCNSGNEKMLYYAIDNFIIPDNFKDLIYITQLVQAESIKEAVEHWRRNKGRCNGALYWQLNDCWPTASWSSIDYFGRWKALQYYSKEFFAPFTISLYDEKNKVNLTVTNETIYNHSYTVNLKLMDFSGKILHTARYEGAISPFAVSNFADVLEGYDINQKNKCELLVVAELMANDKIIAKKTLVLEKPNMLKLSPTKITKTTAIKNNIFVVALKSDSYTHRVCVHLSGSVRPFSDNYFDLIPGEVKIVKVPIGNRDETSCNAGLTITCYNDLKPKYTMSEAKRLKRKIAFMPMNIINRIAYKFT